MQITLRNKHTNNYLTILHFLDTNNRNKNVTLIKVSIFLKNQLASYYLCHIFEEHALQLLPSNNAQKANDVRMSQFGHEFNFPAEILLCLQRSIRFQCFNSNLDSSVGVHKVINDETAMVHNGLVMQKFTFINLHRQNISFSKKNYLIKKNNN